MVVGDDEKVMQMRHNPSYDNLYRPGNAIWRQRMLRMGMVPAINDIKETTNELLLKIVRGGYYGHPNPARGQFVLMGGNPTAGEDPQEITEYPVIKA